MPSQLQQQLLKATLKGKESANNAAKMISLSKRASLLWSPKEVAEMDLEAVYAVGINGFITLQTLDSSFQPYADSLFSISLKNTDRTLLVSSTIFIIIFVKS
jgi:hypothetical protein